MAGIGRKADIPSPPTFLIAASKEIAEFGGAGGIPESSVVN
jgi:hypothetical protein